LSVSARELMRRCKGAHGADCTGAATTLVALADDALVALKTYRAAA
jgi:hypothetical protein